MQGDSLILYKTIGKLIKKVKEEKGIKYTELCYENDISTSTYDNIVSANKQSNFYNIAKVIKALGLNFETFGKLLDDELPKNFLDGQ